MKNITYRPIDDRFMGRKMINGISITVYGKSAKETKARLSQAIKGTFNLEHKNKTPTFEEWWNIWFKEEKEPYLKAGSLKDLRNIFNKMKPIYNIAINKLDTEILKKYLKTLKQNRDTEKIYIYLRACLEYAVKLNKIKSNPFNIIKAPARQNNHKPAFKYDEQVEIITKLKNKPLYPIIMTYLCTGLRKNEFDFKNIEKHIDFENYILKAENLKGHGIKIRYKNIQITKDLCELIKSNIDTIHKYNPESAYKEFAKFLKKINVKGSIVTCRHTFATNNFYLGNPELFISRQMGHSSSQITKDNYTDIDYRLNREKILKLYNNLYVDFYKNPDTKFDTKFGREN